MFDDIIRSIGIYVSIAIGPLVLQYNQPAWLCLLPCIYFSGWYISKADERSIKKSWDILRCFHRSAWNIKDSIVVSIHIAACSLWYIYAEYYFNNIIQVAV